MPALRLPLSLLALVVAALLSAPAQAERFCGGYDPQEPAAMEGARAAIGEAVAAAGLQGRIVSVEPQPPTYDDTRQFAGYLGWVKVQQCAEGHVLVRIDRLCNVQNLSGTDGCAIAE